MAWQDRFKTKMLPLENGCIEYQGAITTGGYGFFWCMGSNIYAHRASWQLHNGEIPEGKLVLHKCDNRLCVNPRHLFLGTHHDNTLDMMAKGRLGTTYGEVHGSKISNETASIIKADLKAGMRICEVVRRHNVSRGIVRHIKTGATWSWMDGPDDQQL